MVTLDEIADTSLLQKPSYEIYVSENGKQVANNVQWKRARIS
jgi:hypothetical protein